MDNLTETEQSAINAFVNQARQATPEQRKIAVSHLESRIGAHERMILPGTKIHVSDACLRVLVAALKDIDR